MVKNPPVNARALGSIPGSGRSPGEGNGNSSILAWRVPWTGKPGGLQCMGSQSHTAERLSTQTKGLAGMVVVKPY